MRPTACGCHTATHSTTRGCQPPSAQPPALPPLASDPLSGSAPSPPEFVTLSGPTPSMPEVCTPACSQPPHPARPAHPHPCTNTNQHRQPARPPEAFCSRFLPRRGPGGYFLHHCCCPRDHLLDLLCLCRRRFLRSWPLDLICCHLALCLPLFIAGSSANLPCVSMIHVPFLFCCQVFMFHVLPF